MPVSLLGELLSDSLCVSTKPSKNLNARRQKNHVTYNLIETDLHPTKKHNSCVFKTS